MQGLLHPVCLLEERKEEWNPGVAWVTHEVTIVRNVEPRSQASRLLSKSGDKATKVLHVTIKFLLDA